MSLKERLCASPWPPQLPPSSLHIAPKGPFQITHPARIPFSGVPLPSAKRSQWSREVLHGLALISSLPCHYHFPFHNLYSAEGLRLSEQASGLALFQAFMYSASSVKKLLFLPLIITHFLNLESTSYKESVLTPSSPQQVPPGSFFCLPKALGHTSHCITIVSTVYGPDLAARL